MILLIDVVEWYVVRIERLRRFDGGGGQGDVTRGKLSQSCLCVAYLGT